MSLPQVIFISHHEKSDRTTTIESCNVILVCVAFSLVSEGVA